MRLSADETTMLSGSIAQLDEPDPLAANLCQPSFQTSATQPAVDGLSMAAEPARKFLQCDLLIALARYALRPGRTHGLDAMAPQ